MTRPPSAMGCCPALLSEYAAGTMDEGLALVVAAYLTTCAEARARIGDCEKLAGAMLETLCDPVGMNQDSLQNVLARLDRAVNTPCPPPPAAIRICEDLELPAPLCALLAARGGRLRWRGIGGGSRLAVLPRPSCGSAVMVMQIAPGQRLPAHSHSGPELTFVMRGAYEDESGRYPAGTLTISAPGTAHRPVADPQSGCVCVSAVTGIAFTGWRERVVFGWWRIRT